MSDGCLKLNPETFFSLQFDCKHVKGSLTRDHQIPSPLHGPDCATLFCGWNEAGLQIRAVIEAPFERSVQPNFEHGDALLLFIDTRDLKSARSVHPFCHQFFFLPNGTAGEYTRFRSQESRPLCDPKDLAVVVSKRKTKVKLEITLSPQCLHGFDQSLFPRLGFAYTIYRGFRSSQSLTAASNEVALGAHPALWASVTLASKET